MPRLIQNFEEIFTLLGRKISVEICTSRHAIIMFYVYILQSLKNKSLYIGYTTNLKKRFQKHNFGKSLATKPFRPYRLISYEAFLNKLDAKNREEYLKSGWGWRSIKKLLKNSLN